MKPNLRIIYDRKKQATTAIPAVVQIEVYFRGKRKYVSTGVKVKSNEWDTENKRVKGSSNDFSSNYHISALWRKIDDFIIDCERNHEEFSFSKLHLALSEKVSNSLSFHEYYLDKLSKRKIAVSTFKKLMSLFSHVERFGKLKKFTDLTQSSLKEFDFYLSENGLCKNSIYDRHKQLKSFINEAVVDGYLKKSPYDGLKIQKGKSKDPVFLLESEIDTIKKYVPTEEKIGKVKDLYLFQCFTGLSYSDLAAFTREDVREIDRKKIIHSSRKKTDESFISLLLPDAETILVKYDYKLPIISNQKYNNYLKVLASNVGINKRLTTHTARHTFATYLLNRGISIVTVARTLGHSKISTTQHYAKMLGKTVIDEMSKLL